MSVPSRLYLDLRRLVKSDICHGFLMVTLRTGCMEPLTMRSSFFTSTTSSSLDSCAARDSAGSIMKKYGWKPLARRVMDSPPRVLPYSSTVAWSFLGL